MNRHVLVPRPETELLAEAGWQFLSTLNPQPSTALDFGTGSGPESVAVGDFNRDGKLDLATANENAATVSILLNNCGSNTTIGVYDPSTASFFLRNSNTGGIADISFTYGPAAMGLIPV